MGKINTIMLVSAISCLVAAVSFMLPWATAHFGETTEARTIYGTTVVITLEPYSASITGFGTGGADASGTGTVSGVPYTFDVHVDMEFTHNLGFVGIAGFATSVVAFVLLLVASLVGSPHVGRRVGYAALAFMAIGLGLGLSYVGVLWAGLGRISGEAEVEVSVPGYPALTVESDVEAPLSEFLEEADALYPGYGLILAIVMWAVSVACFVKGMRAMTPAPPPGAAIWARGEEVPGSA